ncbi:MAG: DNA primase [Muribaculaceae bacterium]|nr:DNA primase [Muribaculaceae bacterium]
MAKIDRITVDKILDATNIVDVVSDFVSLKKRGSSYLGLCPFHNERTPSFSVSPSRGIFKCFSCGKAGTAVSFLMDLENMNYTEALKWLARKYNIEVKERELTSEEKEADAARERMFAANEFALRHFEETLANTEDGRAIGLAYFRERGISDAMIKRFHLGYALDRPDDLYKKAIAAGFTEKHLTETGLAIKTDRGTMYDRFKGRVIYPVHSLSGRVVAFGGRTLRKEKTVAKYVNSPESLIYSKSRELYGMYQARTAIAKKKDCILVEGYMDVISMHQAGVENVVASSGTSLTEGQIRMIKRFADSVTLIYDSDAAGIKASLRGINMLIAAGLSLRVVLLPEGDDPDSFAQNHSSGEVEAYLEEHRQDLIGFKVEVLMKDAGNDPRARTEAINDILQTIAIIPDVVEQSLYLDECARKVGVDAATLSAQLKRFVAKNAEAAYNKRQADKARESISDITEHGTGAAPEMPPVEPPADMAEAQAVTAAVASPDSQTQVSHAVYLAEEEVIKYVLRRGLLYMCDVYRGEGDEEPVPMTVVSYVEAEFANDDICFSYPPFAEIWKQALWLRDSVWPAEWAERERELLEQRATALALGREDIRNRGVDMDTIEKLENALTERLDKEFNEGVDNFASSFVRKHLLRSDDRSLTDLVAKLTSDNVVLSRMYPRVDPRADACRKLPLAVNTLKSVLLKEKLQKLTAELDKPHSNEEAMALMLEYRKLKDISMEFDKYTGEIVIMP